MYLNAHNSVSNNINEGICCKTVTTDPMKKMKGLFSSLWITSLTSVLMLISSLSLAQQKELDTLRKKFEHHRINFPQEKVYAHLSQNVYLTGETVWFKIYYVDGALHHPLNISKVAYLEILDKDNHACRSNQSFIERWSRRRRSIFTSIHQFRKLHRSGLYALDEKFQSRVFLP